MKSLINFWGFIILAYLEKANEQLVWMGIFTFFALFYLIASIFEKTKQHALSSVD